MIFLLQVRRRHQKQMGAKRPAKPASDGENVFNTLPSPPRAQPQRPNEHVTVACWRQSRSVHVMPNRHHVMIFTLCLHRKNVAAEVHIFSAVIPFSSPATVSGGPTMLLLTGDRTTRLPQSSIFDLLGRRWRTFPFFAVALAVARSR
jgi:hypothetical protein